jgi:predicted ATP-grasp superfamily ATP-dependent carboligase
LSAPSVLIAALTGRALAASARRAGYLPLVVDAFGDEDTRGLAAAYSQLGEATRTGFRARPLMAALEALVDKSGQKPAALVLGSGFEDTPKLVAALARHFPLIGSGSDAIARAKDPGVLFPLLDRLAIPHPETRLDPPLNSEGWLSKRIGASGGAHVLPCEEAKTDHGRYYQRRMDGVPASLLAVADRGAMHVIGVSRQWTAGGAVRPYRYAGAAGPAELGQAIEDRMIAAAEALCGEIDVAGLVSFDFLIANDIPYLLEINPRPGATIDVFDDENGNLFKAHLAAGQGRPIRLSLPASARAMGVLYADRGPLTPGGVTWPAWSADRPMPGTRIAPHRPVATVFGHGAEATAAELNCRQRLDELAHMLYSQARNLERTHAEVHRPGTERLGTSGQAR